MKIVIIILFIGVITNLVFHILHGRMHQKHNEKEQEFWEKMEKTLKRDKLYKKEDKPHSYYKPL